MMDQLISTVCYTFPDRVSAPASCLTRKVRGVNTVHIIFHSFTIHFYSRSQVLYPNIFQAPSGWSETRSKVYDCFEFTRCDTTWHMSCWERSKLKTSRLRLFAWGDIKKETRVRQHQWQLLTTREWFETFQPIKVSHHETTTMT